MKVKNLTIYWLIFVALLGIVGIGMIRPNLIGIPVIVSSALLLVLLGSIVTIVSFHILRNRTPRSENYDRGPLSKALGLTIITALLASIGAAIKSLWLDPQNGKFIYENTAAVTGLVAILLIFILTALQKDIYWITRKKTLLLDERQIKERQEVFETAYKFGACIVLGVAWFFANTMHNMPAIIASNHNSVPGHLIWLPFAVATMLFALPLTIAAWKKKS